jgi:hypothetical protein
LGEQVAAAAVEALPARRPAIMAPDVQMATNVRTGRRRTASTPMPAAPTIACVALAERDTRRA